MDTKSGWQCSRCEKVASLCSVWYVCVMSWLPVHYFCQELVNPWMESASWLHILWWFTAFLRYPVSRAWVVWANYWTEFKLFCLVFIYVGAIVIWHWKNPVLCFFIPFAYSHSSVKGLFVWCQVCGHGGHLQHMQDWLKKNRKCPAGCGHDCTWYTILDLHWRLEYNMVIYWCLRMPIPHNLFCVSFSGSISHAAQVSRWLITNGKYRKIGTQCVCVIILHLVYMWHAIFLY